jgi:hypothetical protein
VVEISDGVVYLAMLVRNVGNGMAPSSTPGSPSLDRRLPPMDGGTLKTSAPYFDHEAGQRTVSRFSFIRREDERRETGTESETKADSGCPCHGIAL